MSIREDIQKPAPGDLVELYVLDATALGGGINRFCSSVIEAAAIVWQGNVYSPMPVKAQGFDVVAKGSLPTPSLELADGSGLFRAALRNYNDLVGAKFTRYKTYRKYLDGEPLADPNAHYPVDIFYVERKTKQMGVDIAWELAALTSTQGKRLPGRTILKDVCDQTYRIWDADLGDFDYGDVSCPYTGTSYFDESGQACAQTADSCGQRLSDCQLRYGTDPLPFRGFPGVANVRT